MHVTVTDQCIAFAHLTDCSSRPMRLLLMAVQPQTAGMRMHTIQYNIRLMHRSQTATRGVATRGISVVIPPKSTQVNFL